MPRGIHITKEKRGDLYVFVGIGVTDLYELHLYLFQSNLDIASIACLERYLAHLQQIEGNDEAIQDYLAGPNRRGGQREFLEDQDKAYLIDMLIDENRHIRRLPVLFREFYEEYYGPHGPGLSTVARVVRSHGSKSHNGDT